MDAFLTALWLAPLVFLAVVIVGLIVFSVACFLTALATEPSLESARAVVFKAVASLAAAVAYLAPFFMDNPPAGEIAGIWTVALIWTVLAISIPVKKEERL